MKNLIQDTIRKIENQNIIPESKWKYLLKKYGLWMFFTIVLILGAISFSVALDNSNNLDWDLYRFMHQGRFVYFISILPYFWIILLVIFLIAAFLEIRKTETGYRYSWLKMALITIGGIAIFGILMLLFGIGGKLNSKLVKDVPFYGQHMVITKEAQWMQPTKGFLAGTIISVSEKKPEIEDLNGKKWNIDIDDETLVKSSANISSAEMIKIIGVKTGENNFKAKEIRPWLGRGMMNSNGYHGGMMRRN